MSFVRCHTALPRASLFLGPFSSYFHTFQTRLPSALRIGIGTVAIKHRFEWCSRLGPCSVGITGIQSSMGRFTFQPYLVLPCGRMS